MRRRAVARGGEILQQVREDRRPAFESAPPRPAQGDDQPLRWAGATRWRGREAGGVQRGVEHGPALCVAAPLHLRVDAERLTAGPLQAREVQAAVLEPAFDATQYRRQRVFAGATGNAHKGLDQATIESYGGTLSAMARHCVARAALACRDNGAMARDKTVYTCTECGGTSPKWLGKCPHCGAWNTLEETASPTAVGANPLSLPGRRAEVRPVATLSRDRGARTSSARRPASTSSTACSAAASSTGGVVLIGGDPGIGKSTLLLQAVDALSARAAQRST